MAELSPLTRTLHELRTIQYLEETVGPVGLRRLADALPDEEARAVVQALRRRAANASLELESIIETWTELTNDEPRKPKPLPAHGLDIPELLDTFLEMKRGSAELLRRAARDAPNDDLRRRLVELAEEEERAVRKLEALRPRFS